MGNIFEYFDFRAFLRDYYAHKKQEDARFSLNKWAEIAGFQSKSFLSHVMEGKKNLSAESIHKVAKSLNLGKKSFSYFIALVEFCQTRDFHRRQELFSKLCGYSSRNAAKILKRSQYEFYSVWYHNTIRELATLFDFKENYSLLAQKVIPPIKPLQAKESVALLVRLGLLKKNGTRYEQTHPSVATGDEVRSLALLNFHIQNLVNTADQLPLCPLEERDVSALVLGLSEKGFDKIKSEVRLFRNRIIELARNDTPAQRVYKLNIQFMPTSESLQ